MTKRRAIERLLARVETRFLLSLAILASLVPHRSAAVTDLVFLGLFSIELTLRGVLFASPAPTVRARSRFGAGLVLLVDAVALATFVPWADLGISLDGEGFRLLRLLRLVFVVGYWSPIVRDGIRVLARGDRLRQVALLALGVALVVFAGATVLEHIQARGVDFNGDERLDAGDEAFLSRLWWAFRQVQSADNLVGDPGETAVLIVSAILTVVGLLLVSFLIGIAADIVRELVEVGRNRPVGWRGHTVVVHVTPGLPRLLRELMAYYDRLFRRARFVVADEAKDPPATLREGELTRARYRQTDARGTGLVEHADIATARRVVVLAKPDAPFPDALTAATVLHAREANPAAWIVAEVLAPSSAVAVRVAGGRRTVVVPTERLLGLWALAAVRQPAQVEFVFDLLAARDPSASAGPTELFTFYFDVDGLDGPQAPWDARAWTFAALVEAGLAQDAPVAVLGVVFARPGGAPGAAPDQGRFVLGPPVTAALGPEPVRAIIGLARHFGALETLALHVATSPPPPSTPPAPAALPTLGVAPARREVRRVLVLGFRPAIAVLLSELLAARPDVEAVIAMRHEESVHVAEEALAAHAVGSAQAFVRGAATGLESAFRAGASGGSVRLLQADWTGERALTGLEPGLDHVGSYDLVVLLGAHRDEYDGRTAMAVLRIADLVQRDPSRFPSAFAVLAGVADADLGRRLAEGFARAAGRPLSIIVTEELRALFVFQAIAVPGYERIAAALLAPDSPDSPDTNDGARGHLVRLARHPVHAAGGSSTGDAWTFRTLTRRLGREGLLVVAVELTDPAAPGVTRRILSPAASPQGSELAFDAGQISGVWVLEARAG